LEVAPRVEDFWKNRMDIPEDGFSLELGRSSQRENSRFKIAESE
jgi:hypothetical protein